MNEAAELCKRISGLFEEMNLEVPSESVDLFETGLLDSMTLVQLLVKLEEQLGVSVAPHQLDPDNFRSIQHIASFVLANRQFKIPHARLVSS